MDITIRKARETDILAIAGIYDRILTKEETGGATIGWVRGVYPTESFARKALAAGDLFVLENGGKICATARINQVQVPEYRNADWRYADVPENEIMVLHTLVVDPLCAGGGFGTAFVSFYEQYAFAHPPCPERKSLAGSPPDLFRQCRVRKGSTYSTYAFTFSPCLAEKSLAGDEI